LRGRHGNRLVWCRFRRLRLAALLILCRRRRREREDAGCDEGCLTKNVHRVAPPFFCGRVRALT